MGRKEFMIMFSF